jgi:hypothetical protein
VNTADNLNKLADFIEKNVSQKQLDMSYCRLDEEGNRVHFISQDDCGTSGCALGWAPFVLGLEPVDSDFVESEEWFQVPESRRFLIFHVYGRRIFPDLTDRDWYEVFHERLSSDKAEVIARLRDMAERLKRKQSAAKMRCWIRLIDSAEWTIYEIGESLPDISRVARLVGIEYTDGSRVWEDCPPPAESGHYAFLRDDGEMVVTTLDGSETQDFAEENCYPYWCRLTPPRE